MNPTPLDPADAGGLRADGLAELAKVLAETQADLAEGGKRDWLIAYSRLEQAAIYTLGMNAKADTADAETMQAAS